MVENRWSVLIDLDSLFDTRFSILMDMDSKIAMDLASSGKYFNRIYERFDGIDMDEYEERYRNRNIDDLKRAKVTRILPILHSYSILNETVLQKTPGLFSNTIIINVHPYKLSGKEMDMIARILFILLGRKAEIKFIDAPDAILTPKWIKENVSIWIRYDYHKWFEYHGSQGTFEKDTCPSISLLGPRVIFGSIDTETVTIDQFFSLVETTFSPICNLALIPVEFFTLNVEFAKKEK